MKALIAVALFATAFPHTANARSYDPISRVTDSMGICLDRPWICEKGTLRNPIAWISNSQENCEKRADGDLIDCIETVPGMKQFKYLKPDLEKVQEFRQRLKRQGYQIQAHQLTSDKVNQLIRNESDFQRLKYSANETKDLLESIARLEIAAERSNAAELQQGDNEKQKPVTEPSKQMSSLQESGAAR